MPSFYAHNRFGKEVCKELPKEIRQIIQEYPSAYKAGLQGPDFLFFYRATSIPWDMPSINSPFFPFWKPFGLPSGKKDAIVRSMPISLDLSVILCLTAKHIRTSMKRQKKRDLTTLSWKWNLTAI